ncbi:MAG: hypothetical protein CVU06_16250, partial [Bacteroidetes bacterium HGW-Bacteroidetes-22]
MGNQKSIVLNQRVMDSLIREEFRQITSLGHLVYGIYDQNQKVLYASPDGISNTFILESPLKISLSCIHKSERLLLAVCFPNRDKLILSQLSIWLLLSVFFLLAMTFAFYKIIMSFLKHKKLSEMKTDFVNNMTHEFKTPIAAISLASEMLIKPSIIEDKDRIIKYAGLIFDENQRLKNQVDQILQISVLDNEEYTLDISKMDAHETLEGIIETFRLVQHLDVGIHSALHAKNAVILADQHHFVNMLTNLLDNAVKYSLNKPEITISTQSSDNWLIISIQDNGIGIGRDRQVDVFKKFYRVPTGDLHNVKGFGLGLFYVKAMAEAQHGKIALKSELGKGSTFDLWFPLV